MECWNREPVRSDSALDERGIGAGVRIWLFGAFDDPRLRSTMVPCTLMAGAGRYRGSPASVVRSSEGMGSDSHEEPMRLCRGGCAVGVRGCRECKPRFRLLGL